MTSAEGATPRGLPPAARRVPRTGGGRRRPLRRLVSAVGRLAREVLRPGGSLSLPRAASLLARGARALPAPVRRGVAALLLAALSLVTGYFAWLRDSSLVRVETVRLSGITATPEAPRLRAALVDAARDMTTLHVRHGALERVAAAYPGVASIRATAQFPHTLAIEVVEQRQVAVIRAGGAMVPVAVDGTILRAVPVRESLPALPGAGPTAGALTGVAARRALHVAAAAPAPLRPRLLRVIERPQLGVVAELRDGPAIYFGDGSALRAKWVAAASVLADRASRGASYVDVRLPGRPTAGGLAGETGTRGVDPRPPGAPATDGPSTAAPGPALPAASSPRAGTQAPAGSGSRRGGFGEGAPTAPANVHPQP